jgi:hypothetical protein
MKKIVFILLFTLSSTIYADWKFIGKTDTNTRFFVDSTRIQTIKNLKRAWTKSEMSDNTSVRVYQEFDCTEKK